jgi:NAD(P)H-hydrate epimerase
MGDIDRIAVEDVGLELIQMMEHAGRTLAGDVFALINADDSITVLAGGGGNGGGGLACARHLANRGYDVQVVLDRPVGEFDGVPATQLTVLEANEVPITTDDPELGDLVVDALVGYGLDGAPRGRTASLIDRVASTADRVVSLDVPSGLDATTGERPGVAVDPMRTVNDSLFGTDFAVRLEPR